MFSSLDLNDTFNNINREVCHLINAERACVYILDREKNRLWTMVHKNMHEIDLEQGGVIALAAKKGVSLRIDQVSEDKRFIRKIDEIFKVRTYSIMCVPLRDLDDYVTGVIVASNKLHGVFSADDLGMLSMLSNLSGIMLNNSILFDKKQNEYHKIVKLLDIANKLYSVRDLD